MNTTEILNALRKRAALTGSKLAELVGTSLVSVTRWERGTSQPSPAEAQRLTEIYAYLFEGRSSLSVPNRPFSSRRTRGRTHGQGVLGETLPLVKPSGVQQPPILARLSSSGVFRSRDGVGLEDLFQHHPTESPTIQVPHSGGISAGKNTHTYDAHTYHTKVPPQGISELVAHYLPDGGLVLDPFAGSGMTGVAASVIGNDCILNELSPAASFISNRFTTALNPRDFEAAVGAVIAAQTELRQRLYSTQCRECGKSAELLYTVWSYQVLCNDCGHQFVLWDHCKKFGKCVKEHKILGEFPCPSCRKVQQKSRLKRTYAVPVLIGYKCCGSRAQEVTHPPSPNDLQRTEELETSAPLADGFFPDKRLPDGVNLRQPVKHGLDSIQKFYTRRNLSALSHIWRTIHHFENTQLAAHLGFVFTSLYQRVSRLSEFRFWGGSGNMARFNVPFIFNESNVFLSFERKARTILDHLETTASSFKGSVVVVNGSATSMSKIPNNSVDLIFTDPPFGANINYSEMNFLWESWLGSYTDTADEAIVNRVQGKGVREYEDLMTRSLKECFRVLRPGHWMLLVFMNSSSQVWAALRNAIDGAGFRLLQIDAFDKQHGTFKQFVSDNTAGMDLVLHCLKQENQAETAGKLSSDAQLSVFEFLNSRQSELPTNTYLHVGRCEELDYRTLYSEWLARTLTSKGEILGFAEFRKIVGRWVGRIPPTEVGKE